VFSLLEKTFPECVRSTHHKGITQVELNKLLEQNGFLRIRLRRVPATSIPSSTPSSYRYGSRRWRNPDDEADRAFLLKKWEDFNGSVETPCPVTTIFELLRRVIVTETRKPRAAARACASSPSANVPVAMKIQGDACRYAAKIFELGGEDSSAASGMVLLDADSNAQKVRCEEVDDAPSVIELTAMREKGEEKQAGQSDDTEHGGASICEHRRKRGECKDCLWG